MHTYIQAHAPTHIHTETQSGECNRRECNPLYFALKQTRLTPFDILAMGIVRSPRVNVGYELANVFNSNLWPWNWPWPWPWPWRWFGWKSAFECILSTSVCEVEANLQEQVCDYFQFWSLNYLLRSFSTTFTMIPFDEKIWKIYKSRSAHFCYIALTVSEILTF